MPTPSLNLRGSWETWVLQSQLQGHLWGALCEPYFERRDRRDRSGRALYTSEGNHGLSGRAWSFEFRLGLIPPLLNSYSMVLRNYILSPPSAQASVSWAVKWTCGRGARSLWEQFFSTAPSPKSPAQNCPHDGQGEVTRLRSWDMSPEGALTPG